MKENVMLFEEFCTRAEIIDDENIRQIAYYSYLCGLKQAGIDVGKFFMAFCWGKENAQKRIRIENKWKEENSCNNLKDAKIVELSNEIIELANNISEYTKKKQEDFRVKGDVLLVHGIVD